MSRIVLTNKKDEFLDFKTKEVLSFKGKPISIKSIYNHINDEVAFMV